MIINASSRSILGAVGVVSVTQFTQVHVADRDRHRDACVASRRVFAGDLDAISCPWSRGPRLSQHSPWSFPWRCRCRTVSRRHVRGFRSAYPMAATAHLAPGSGVLLDGAFAGAAFITGPIKKRRAVFRNSRGVRRPLSAHAGIIRTPSAPSSNRIRTPHLGGDDPTGKAPRIWPGAYAPSEWGCSTP